RWAGNGDRGGGLDHLGHGDGAHARGGAGLALGGGPPAIQRRGDPRLSRRRPGADQGPIPIGTAAPSTQATAAPSGPGSTRCPPEKSANAGSTVTPGLSQNAGQLRGTPGRRTLGCTWPAITWRPRGSACGRWRNRNGPSSQASPNWRTPSAAPRSARSWL